MVREDIIEGDFCQRIHPPPPQHHEEHQVAARCVDLMAVVFLVMREDRELALRDCGRSTFLDSSLSVSGLTYCVFLSLRCCPLISFLCIFHGLKFALKMNVENVRP